MHTNAGTAVSCHLCQLPPLLSAATVAVAKLTGPARTAPPLPELCRTGLPGFAAVAGDAYGAAASHLHPRHQLPFVLSRVAATAALAQAKRDDSSGAPLQGQVPAFVFTGHRRDAATQYGCQLSMSHEDAAAAAVAWRLPPARPTSNFESEANHLGTSASAPSLAFAVDVVPVEEVHRVWRRFPHLGRRWMPQSLTTTTPAAVRRALACMQAGQPASANTSGSGVRHPNKAALPSLSSTTERRDEWWRHFRTPCANAAEAYGAAVLAQHWGARECAVKLVGVSGRAFAYDSVHAPLISTAGEALSTFVLPFTNAFMVPHVLYHAAVGGTEGQTLRRHGLQPLLYLYTWTEWVPASETADAPHVVVLACAPHITSSD